MSITEKVRADFGRDPVVTFQPLRLITWWLYVTTVTNGVTWHFRKLTTGRKRMTKNTRASMRSQEAATKRGEEGDVFLSWIKGCDVVI